MKRSRSIFVFGLLLCGVLVIASMAVFAPQYFRLQPPMSAPVTQPADERFFLAKIFEDSGSGASTFVTTVEVIQRLLLAVVLSGILAFRPRKNVPLFRRSLFVSQTQILLSVVAAALMMVVGDNAARAFAIFAAFSHEHPRPEGSYCFADKFGARFSSRRRTLGPRHRALSVCTCAAVAARIQRA